MKTIEQWLARKLLTINAVKLNTASPFVWTSGWRSPIYCDIRKTLSYPSIRSFIKLGLSWAILEYFENTEAIIGMATGAIAQGSMVANELNFPFAYIRLSQKEHGLKKFIEGNLKFRSKVVIIEDLISTGGSVLNAIKIMKDAGCQIEGILSIFTYGLSVAEDQFKLAEVKLVSLCNYDAILKEAIKIGFIDDFELKILQKWRKNPSKWEKLK